jgi:hypothetical protein
MLNQELFPTRSAANAGIPNMDRRIIGDTCRRDGGSHMTSLPAKKTRPEASWQGTTSSRNKTSERASIGNVCPRIVQDKERRADDEGSGPRIKGGRRAYVHSSVRAKAGPPLLLLHLAPTAAAAHATKHAKSLGAWNNMHLFQALSETL